MQVVIGTSAGVFADDGQPANGIGSQVVRQVIRADGQLFAAAADGVYASRDGSAWSRVLDFDGAEGWSVAASPHENGVLYAGTAPAHLLISRDMGETWTEVQSFLDTPGAERWCVPGNPAGARALAFAFDPFEPRHLWAGVEVGGVVASSDGGATWTASWVGPNADVHLLVPHPTRHGVVFATCGFGRNDDKPNEPAMAGPYRSDDGGHTWRHLAAGMDVHYTRPMCIDPRPPHVLTVPGVPDVRSSIRDEGGSRCVLYQSKDDGASWASLGDADHSPSAARLTAITPDPQVLSGVVVGTETGEVWRVSPSAEWTCLREGLPAVQALVAVA